MANIYRHYKGGIYNVIGECQHTETLEKMVIYEDDSGRLWARPIDSFMEKVEVNGKEVPRFQHLGYFNHD